MTKIDMMVIAFETNGIVLAVSADFLADWPSDDKVGFYGEHLIRVEARLY